MYYITPYYVSEQQSSDFPLRRCPACDWWAVSGRGYAYVVFILSVILLLCDWITQSPLLSLKKGRVAGDGWIRQVCNFIVTLLSPFGKTN